MAISTKSSIFDIWQGSEYPSGDAIVKKKLKSPQNNHIYVCFQVTCQYSVHYLIHRHIK